MAMKTFELKPLKPGVLTGVFQEPTPRNVRNADSDEMIEDRLQFACELEVDNIQVSSARHPAENDMPAVAKLDPVDIRRIKNG